MTKRLLPVLLSLLLLLSACGKQQPDPVQADDSLTLVATTYPLYLFLSELTRDAEGISVLPLINQGVSCLHDYTLTVNDMKLLERADMVFLNGGSLDAFILDAVKQFPSQESVDCSLGLTQTQNQALTDDPHFWLDPKQVSVMLDTICTALTERDPAQAALYSKNKEAAQSQLTSAYADMKTKLSSLSIRQIITFHDGFSHFAKAFDLDLVLAVEEEEGQEASAQVIKTALTMIDEYSLSAIFSEEYSADATAQAISREAGIEVATLSLIMSGPTENVGLDRYLQAMQSNIDTILEAYT